VVISFLFYLFIASIVIRNHIFLLLWCIHHSAAPPSLEASTALFIFMKLAHLSPSAPVLPLCSVTFPFMTSGLGSTDFLRLES